VVDSDEAEVFLSKYQGMFTDPLAAVLLAVGGID
jgi:hypothetical protein